MKYRLKITWRDGKVTYSGEMETLKELEDFRIAISATAAILWADPQESNNGFEWQRRSAESRNSYQEFADLQRRVSALELYRSSLDHRISVLEKAMLFSQERT